MNKTNAAIVRTLLLGTSCLSMFAFDAARAQPAGGTVALGSATITNPSATSTLISQTTDKLVVNWDSFSIAAGERVQFSQPNAAAIALNRILGADPTSIYGSLLANGQVWIVNGNGVLFGQGSRINVGGLIATTADIADGDFASGNYSFSGGTGASVSNQGTIRTGRQGYAVLSGASASNSGLISADSGTVVIGGASAFTVDFQGDGLLRYAVTTPGGAATNGPTGASNSGTITATRVVMTARAAAGVQDAVVNNTGMISASNAHVQNGEVVLDGGDGAGNDGSVDVSVGGTVDAKGFAPGGTGGSVTVTGNNITVADNAEIDVSGRNGGGTVKIGGDVNGGGTVPHAANVTVGAATIKANATHQGDGGTVVVWSDGTTDFSGIVSAKGGSTGGDGGVVETAGQSLHVTSTASVDTSAIAGTTGNWVLQSNAIDISDAGGTLPEDQDPDQNGTIAPSTIAGSLPMTNVALQTVSDITVYDPIGYTAPNALSLLASGNIYIAADVQNAGSGAINVIAGWDGTTTEPSLFTQAGVYGNATDSTFTGFPGPGGSVFVSSDYDGTISPGPDETHSVALGSAGGTTTVAGDAVMVLGIGANAQIGYQGAGGGDIVVRSTTIFALGGTSGASAIVGNGLLDGSTNGDATGNIDIESTGVLALGSLDPDNTTWIGNLAGTGFSEQGNVTLIGATGVTGDGVDLSAILEADLAGGDFTLGFSADSMPTGQILYNSAHNLTILAAGDLELGDSIVNDGTGAITLVAGWDGITLDPSLLSQGGGTFGNNDAKVYLGRYAEDDISVGSAGGQLTVLTDSLKVEAEAGNAQLGYHGAGGGGGDISVTALGDVELKGGDPTQSGFAAMIGNGALDNSVTGAVTGDISLSVGGTLKLKTVTGGCPDGADNSATTFIGNVGAAGGDPASGDLFLLAGAVDDQYDANGGIGRIVAPDLANGDVTLAIASSHDLTVDQDVQSGNHSLTLLTGGDITIESAIEAGGSGAITLVAGWDGTYDPNNIGAPGTYGVDTLGTITIGGANAAGDARVGAAEGDTRLYGANLYLDADNGSAQLGYNGGAGGGNIVVGMTGNIEAFGGSTPGYDALIGNGSLGGDVIGNITGNISLSAGGDTEFDDNYVDSALTGRGWLGNVAGDGYTETGDVTVLTSTGYLRGDYLTSDLGTTAGTGGNVFIGFADPEISPITLGGLTYSSANNFTWAAAGDLTVIGSVSNSGNGAVTLVAGWDGQTVGSAADIQAADGAYGLNDAVLTLGGNSQYQDVSVGSAGGLTTVLTGDLTIAPKSGDYAQLGYHGAGGGDIVVRATGDLTLDDSSGVTATIGNGYDAATGAVTGNIDIAAGGNLTLTAGEGGEGLWIGNRTSNADVESGNVSIVAGAVQDTASFGSPDAFGSMLLADLGTTAQAGSGGDVTLAITNPRTDYINAYLGMGAMNYDSPHALMLLSTGNITLPYSIQNAGAGDLTILAGWNPAVAPADVLTTPGGYGQNGAFAWVVGAAGLTPTDYNPNTPYTNGYAVLGSDPGAAIGSKGGATTVAGAQVFVEGLSGFAQIGYHGSGGTGAINVIAAGSGPPVEGGQLGVCQKGSGDICVAGGRDGSYAGRPSYAQIGNLGMGVAGTSQSDISVSASGNIVLTGGGNYLGGAQAGSGTIANAYAQIGAGDASRSVAQTVAGAISVHALGAVNLAGGTAAGSAAWLGNRTGISGNQSGDITLLAGTLDGNALSAMLVEDLGASASTGGDMTIGLSGTGPTGLSDAMYNSPHSLTYLASGDVYVVGSVQNGGTGAITLVAGWDGHTLDPAHFADDGVYGKNGAMLTIGGQYAGGNAALGSAGGATTVLAGELDLVAQNGHAQLGYHGAGTGDITAQTTGDINLVGGDLYHTGPAAMIGNGKLNSTNFSGSTGGNIFLSAGGTMSLSTVSCEGGDCGPDTNGNYATVYIGNVAGTGGQASGNLVMLAAGFDDGNDANGGFGEVLASNIGHGDVTIGQTDASNPVVLPDGGTFDSAYALTILSAGDIQIEAAIENSGSGAVNLVAGWNGTTIDPAHLGGDGVYGRNGGSILLGGAGAAGNAAIGSAGGAANLYAQDVTLSSLNGYAQLGYAGSGTGAVNVLALGTVTLSGGGDLAHFAQIGSGSTFGANTNAVDVNVSAASIQGSGIASVVADDLSLTAGTVGNADASLQIAADTLTLATAGGNAYLTTPRSLAITSADLGGGNLTIAAGGAITQTGTILSGLLNVSTTSGAITLTNAGNAFGGLTVATQGSDNATFVHSSLLTVAGSDVGGTLTLTAGTSINQTGAIQAASLNATASNGTISLNVAGNSFSRVAVSTIGTNDASVVDATGFQLDTSTVGGTLTFSAGGTVTEPGTLHSAGLSASTTAGDIVLGDAGNAVSGTVAFHSAGSAYFNDTLSIAAGPSTAGGLLTLISGGGISQTGALQVGNLAATANGGDVALTDAANAFSSLRVSTTGNASVTDASALTVDNAAVGGTLTLIGASIAQSGPIQASSLSATANNGGIVLNDSRNSFATLSLGTTAANNASVADSSGFTVASAAVGGTLTLAAGGAVGQSAALHSAGLTVATTAGDIILTDAGNAVTGTVAFATPGTASFTDTQSFSMGTSSVGGLLTLVSAGGIGQTGAVAAGGLNATANGGAIALGNSGNSFSTLTVASSGDASVTDGAAVSLGGANVGGAFALSAGGAITQTAAITSNSLNVSTTLGAIALTNAGNAFGGLTVSTAGSDNAAFAQSGLLTVASANVGGTLSLTAGTSLAQTGAIHAAGLNATAGSGTIALTNAGNSFAALALATTGSNGATVTDSAGVALGSSTIGGALTLSAGGAISQSGALQSASLSVTTGTGNIVLTNAANAVSGAIAFTTPGAASFADTGAVDLGGASVGGVLTLQSGGGISQSGAVAAGGLSVTASGSIVLTNTANAVTGSVAFTTPGTASFTDSTSFGVGATSVDGLLTLVSGGGISQSGAVQAASLNATANNGAIALTNSGNSFATLTLSTGAGNNAAVTDSTGVTLAASMVGGKLTLSAGGAVGQSGALQSIGLNVSTAAGAIALTNTANAVSSPVQFSTPGAVTFYDTRGLALGGATVGGDLVLLSKGNVGVTGAVQSDSGAITVVAGWDGTTTNAAQFGASGVYGNNNDSVFVGGSGASGNAAIGSRSGATTVYAANLSILATNGAAQLGYHGAGGGAIKVVVLNDVTLTAGAGSALIGNGSLGSDVSGNVTGDIDVRMGGDIALTDGANGTAWLGNVAHAGTETGNLILVASEDDSPGDKIGDIITGDIAGGDVTLGFTGGGDGGPNKNFAYNSSHALNLLTAGNLVFAGSIQNAGSGAINLVAGWDGHTLAPSSFGQSGVTGNNGKGVTIGGANATGGVAVGSAGGTTSVYGASLLLAATNGYAQLGFNGHGTGGIAVTMTGAVTLTGGAAAGDFAQIGNGGLKTGGNNSGDILLAAGGDIVLTGGAGSEAYVQIGHGGAESNTGSSGYSNSGAIGLTAADLTLGAGTGSAAYAQIGQGGYESGLNLAGGQAFNGGAITATIGHLVSLTGNGANAYAQIGNGGSQSNLNPAAAAGGTDSGNIVVSAPNGPSGAITMTAGAGANAYGQIGNGGYAVNAGVNATAANFMVTGNVTVTDLALTGGAGANGYSQIGNGDASHNGVGNVGGNIVINANGNITYTPGTGLNSQATIGNFSGQGTVTGTLAGANPPSQITNDPGTIGVVVASIAGNKPAGNGAITTIATMVVSGVEQNGGASTLIARIEASPPGPLASLGGGGDSSTPNTSDNATVVIADSLDGAKKAGVTQNIIAGMLSQSNPVSAGHTVHAIPPADQDFSSWGNEALWQ